MLAKRLLISDKPEGADYGARFRVGRNLLLALSSIVFFCQSSLSHALDNEHRLAQVKAAYVYNILKFTSWPADSWSKNDELQVCVVGRDLVTDSLKKGVKGRQAQGRQIEVLVFNDSLFHKEHSKILASLERCHFIYISEEVAEYNALIVKLMKGKNTLLASNSADFVHQGGMVGIGFDQGIGRVRFLINLDAVKSGGLAISSKLLKFANVIGKKKDRNSSVE